MLHDEDTPRGPSPFVAAFLSLIFPGLGQLYAGLPARALGFAAPPFLVVALLAGIGLNHNARDAVIAAVFAPTALRAILLFDIVAFVYRLVAVVDAYRVAVAMGPARPTRLGVPRIPVRPLPLAGLIAVVLVAGMGHVALARYDLIALDTIEGLTSSDTGNSGPDATPIATTGASAGATGAAASPTSTPPGTSAPAPSIVPWNGTDRLNILLIGVDQRPKDATFNTDTMIVASIDPASGQIAMFSVPRDTENVPLPPGAAADYLGGVYPNKINSLWTYARGNPGLFPGTDQTRGYTALKGALGALLGIDIKYYVEVNFEGFIKVVDTLGGAMIDVQTPVTDQHYPTSDGRGALNLYIAPGIQHMDGAQALAYARSRHASNDFDRAQRQQRVIVSMREQTDVLSFLDPSRLERLSGALKSAIHTDFPADQLPQLISLIERVDTKNLRSFVFTPPLYMTECAPAQCQVHYFIHPKVALIQQAVAQAFTIDPALLKSQQKLAAENATVWVLNGSGKSGQATSIVDYLQYLGVAAIVPPVNGGRADSSGYTGTVVTFYNGAEQNMPETVRVLQKAFGVTIETKTDPTVKADVIVITGSATPGLTPPPTPGNPG